MLIYMYTFDIFCTIAQDTLGDGVTPAGQVSEVTIAQQTAEGSTIATEGQGHEKEGPSIMVRVELTPGFDGSKCI